MISVKTDFGPYAGKVSFKPYKCFKKEKKTKT